MRLYLNGLWNAHGADRNDNKTTIDMPAIVPGNIELDLHRNGYEPEPFFGENECRYLKYESWDWRFERSFTAPVFNPETEDLFLVFEGLNCFADIRLNDETIALSANSLIPRVIQLNDRRVSRMEPGKEYKLTVFIESALLHSAVSGKYDESADYPVSLSACEGSDEYTRLRMPAHSFGWDIMPRFPSAGMWRDVYIETKPKNRIAQTYFTAKHCNERKANIVYKYRLSLCDTDFSSYMLKVFLDGELKLEIKPHFICGEGNIYLDEPRLWWPRGYGEAATYEATTELWRNDKLVDSKTETIGVRTIEIAHRMASGDEGEFLIKVNDCPILAKGSNWVPLDAFHSRDKERYEKAVDLFVQSNCNIMRLWGGNVYEDDRLFELCDNNGILVWHDFSFACAIYPQDHNFTSKIKQEARSVIRRLRNHPCILLWAGDNEVDETYYGRKYAIGNRYNKVSREALAECVRDEDPFRMYLPSSPYIDGGVERYEVPEQHLWDARAYYKDDFYRLTKAHFISEYGYHGCPSAESLRRFIPKNELNDMYSGSWVCHSSEYSPLFKRSYYRNQLMRDQVELMFGSAEHDLELFSFLSQFTQAEAFKFMIEQTRLNKWRRTGLIWWNMLDGWPGISDSAVDWYFTKKRSWYAAKMAQEPINVIVSEVSGWHRQMILANDSRRDAQVSVKITDPDRCETLFEGRFISRANENANIGEIRVMPSRQQLLIIEFAYEGKAFKSHYLCGFPPFKVSDALRWSKFIDEE